MNTLINYPDKYAALSAARKLAAEHGHAFVIGWPANANGAAFWTVEPRKPHFRSPEMSVIEVTCDGRDLLA
jgi:hypothetical protein